MNPRALPNLCELNLSRNQFHYPIDHSSNVGVFPFIDAIEQPNRITHFHLPSVRSQQDVDGILSLLEQIPTRTIEVARLYRVSEPFAKQLNHPRLSLPLARPWPPVDTVSGRQALTIKLPNEPYGENVSLSCWIEELEYEYDQFDGDTKTAWLKLWTFLDGLGWEKLDHHEIVLPFSAATLLTAIESIDVVTHDSVPLRKALQALSPSELEETDVSIKRYWGW